jgi:putative DNA primase/helicase
MRENTWEYEPHHNIILATNNKPRVLGDDHGIWRRVKLLPFEVTVEDRDAVLDMPEKLRAEHEGILAWLVEGCLEWQQNGLCEPDCVRVATEEYRQEQDRLSAFLDEKTLAHGTEQARNLYCAYVDWMSGAGEEFIMSEVRFSKAMKKRGYEKKKSGVWLYLGISLIRQVAR